MNTRYIKISAMSMGLLAAMSSCSGDFLDTTSKTDLNQTSFYKNEVQMEHAIVGCYDGYQRTVSNGSWPSLFQTAETMSDDCLGGGGPDDRSDRLMDRFDINLKSDATSLWEGIWKDYYAGIYRCNQVLASMNAVAWKSQASRNDIEGQARAIRGAEYFDMVKMFENIPLLTTPSKDIVPQAVPDSVYAQIVTDLRWAADSMKAEAIGVNDFGKVGKYAAEAMLARVYLFYDGVYNNNAGGTMPGGLTKAQALSYCEDVISSGNYSLEPDFRNLWPAASTEATTPDQGRKGTYVEASKEIVWVMKFNNDDSYNSPSEHNGNRFVINLGLRDVGYGGEYAPYGFGWGACPITPYANSLYNENDTRLGGTIINANGIGSFKDQTSSSSTSIDYTGYINKKYIPLVYSDGTSVGLHDSDVTGGDYQLDQDQNWILIRYADVLLMAAELGSPNAMAYVNQVRERAYGNNKHNLDAAPTQQQIWDERRLELMGEGLRYYDLMRQGLDAFVKAQMGQANSDGTTTGTAAPVYNNGIKSTVSYTEQNIREKRGFLQIPLNQITLSGNVYKQNAGW